MCWSFYWYDHQSHILGLGWYTRLFKLYVVQVAFGHVFWEGASGSIGPCIGRGGEAAAYILKRGGRIVLAHG